MVMQVVRVYNLRCDQCGEYGPDHIPSAVDERKASMVRRHEVEAGWRRVSGRDLCPICTGINPTYRP